MKTKADADTTVRLAGPPVSLIRGHASRATAACSRKGLSFLADIPDSVRVSIPGFGALTLTRMACHASVPGSIPDSAVAVKSELLPDGCELWMDHLLASQLLGRLIGVSEVEPVAGRLSAGQHGLLSALVWRTMHSLGFSARSRAAVGGAPRERIVFEVLLDTNSEDGSRIAGTVFVALDSEHLQALESMPVAVSGALAQKLGGVPVYAKVEFATVTLPALEVDRLAPNDVAVFSGHPTIARRDSLREVACRVRIGEFAADGFLHGNGDIVLRSSFLADKPAIARIQGDARMNDTTARIQDNTTAVLASAPIEVTVEVGRIALTGAEVAGLCNGSVLQIGRRLDGPVELTAAGRLIGRGVLVDIEGELGVRLTERIG